MTSRFGAMYFADLPGALAESKRVLRPGGRLAWLVWGSFDQPFYRATAQVAMRYAGISDPPPEAAQPFCFGEGELLQRALTHAEFEVVEEIPQKVLWSWPGPPNEACDVWREGTAPFRGILDRLDRADRERAKAEITERLRRFYRTGCVQVPENVILATGVRPLSSSRGERAARARL